MKMSKELLKVLREDINEALKAVAIKHGLESLKAGNCSYDDTQATFKVAANLKVADETKNAKIAFNLRMIGLEPTDLNRVITIAGKQFKIVGVNTRSRKNPIEIERVSDGAKFCCPVTSVK